MTRPWRVLVEDGVGAAAGLAADEQLARDAPLLGTSLRLYTYRTHCALVGRFQDPAAELDLSECAVTGTEVCRRPTGGGAIVMGHDQLGVALAAPLAVAEGGMHPRLLLARYAEGVRRGLATLGVATELRGKNDLVAGGRKIAGLGIAVIDGGVLFHASILVDLDVPFMLRVLRVPARALGAGAIEAVERRITTVRRETGRAVTTLAMRDAVARGFASAFAVTLAAGATGSAERAGAEVLRQERYATSEWLFPPGLRAERHGEAVVETPFGTVRADLVLAGGVIANVIVSGDFLGNERAIDAFESSLRWIRPSRRVLLERARAAAVDGAAGVSAQALADAVWRACVDARAAGTTTGACYYPSAVSAGIAGGVS
ncbi:MAG TPA: hypothetical protein VIN34_04805 [Candidatus Limnocylindria bacterium]